MPDPGLIAGTAPGPVRLISPHRGGQALNAGLAVGLFAGLLLVGCAEQADPSTDKMASDSHPSASLILEADAPPAGSEAAEAIGLQTPAK